MNVMARSSTAALVGLLLVTASPAPAYFDDTAVDARAISLGASAMALNTRASAYYWNPAGLAGLQKLELIADYARPYALDELSTSALVFGGRAFDTGYALAWHHLGVRDVYSEDQFNLAAGREIAAWSNGHRLEGGATLKIGRIAFQPFADPLDRESSIDFGSRTNTSLDLGLRWVSPWQVDFAAVVRDLFEPTYEFIEGSGGGVLARRYELALAYRWHEESTLTAGWSELDASGTASINLGMEIWFYDVFAIRSGITNASKIYSANESPTEFQFTGGFGIQERGWHLDTAVFTNRDLGASYRVSLLIPIGEAP